MILGDPYKFGIITQNIKDWNEKDSLFNNGVLMICIDGAIYPDEVYTATLSREIGILKKQLMNINENEQIFFMEKERAFKYIYEVTYPSDINIDNDYSYDITPDTISDRHCKIFSVCYENKVRFLGGRRKKDENRYDIREAYVSLEVVEKIAMEL